MLIATLPPIEQKNLCRKIVASPHIRGLRFNSGIPSPHSPEETLREAKELCNSWSKPLWLDLKGRQLRITNWSAPFYGQIKLNHKLEVEHGAEILFRGGDRCKIKFVRDNIVFVEPSPRQALGEGQSVNIIGEYKITDDYFTEKDLAYLEAAKKVGVKEFMLSFYEDPSDITNFLQHYGEISDPIQIVLKIESIAGLRVMPDVDRNRYRIPRVEIVLMAARDDLFTMIGENKTDMIRALRSIIKDDPDAILASRIFSSLEHSDTVSLADYCDIILMRQFGYKSFMLSDEICFRHFDTAIKHWTDLANMSF